MEYTPLDDALPPASRRSVTVAERRTATLPRFASEEPAAVVSSDGVVRLVRLLRLPLGREDLDHGERDRAARPTMPTM